MTGPQLGSDLPPRPQSPAPISTEEWSSTAPLVPEPGRLWRPLRLWVWVVVAVLALRAIPSFIVDLWFLESVQKSGVFWTNIGAQAVLFGVGATLAALCVLAPLRRAENPALHRAAIDLGLWFGLITGWWLAGRYLDYLLAIAGRRFGETDPVFGLDVGFYVFRLPALEATLALVAWCASLALAAHLAGRWNARHRGPRTVGVDEAWPLRLGRGITPGLLSSIVVLGTAIAVRTFLTRYALLVADNEASGVRVGAEYLDVTGGFSTLNLISVSVVVELGLLAMACWVLVGLRDAASRATPTSFRWPARGAVGLLGVELFFFIGVVVRDHVAVAPNEPTIQLPYIRRHMDATLRGYRLDRVRAVPWVPPTEPLSPEALLASATVAQAPILPGWVSYLEQPPDVQHFDRLQSAGTTMVYGPMLQVYQQEQQLRPYYHFVSVDGVRYMVDGKLQMYTSAVRELPSLAFRGPKEWLRYWGSAALMYTHGFGLVMSPANEVDSAGSPVYALHDIPPVGGNRWAGVEPRIYYGEGAKDDYVLTNVAGLREFDHPTRQSRTEFVFPAAERAGIPVRSLFRRLVFAAATGDVTAFLFSRFIDHDRTRLHLHRTPLRRIRRVAPFLFLDSNPYAFIADQRVLWMVNGLTTSDRFPYSFRERLGDKADERAVEPFPERVINYAEDAVKVTIDAFSGEVHLYRIADDPIVLAWDRIYPGLLEPRSAMPEAVQAQLTYPLQWFHIQFDDIYKRYHQRDPLEFYNAEDLWDDADEVLGSIGRGLTEFGTTDQMTFSYEGHPLLIDPTDLPPGTGLGPPGQLRYVLLMPFTPEGARNLRSVVMAVQDPDRYGELLSLQVPQGMFLPGPEQADTYIDNDAQINQQITLWVRHGSEVVRGHTLLLPIAGDLLYVEPLWIVSLQNELPQLKLFSVVYRGRTTMGTSLSEAIRLQGVPEQAERESNALPWFKTPRGQGSTPDSGRLVGRAPR